jgi:hypothetical protein
MTPLAEHVDHIPNRTQSLRVCVSSALRFLWILWVVVIVMSSVSPVTAGEPVLLADPSVPLEQAWTHQRFRGETDYQRTELDGVAAIRAVGRRSASGLYRGVDYRVLDQPWLEWTWRVDRLQPTADIRVTEREDFAAAIFLIFGRPDMFNPDVSTLVYVWASDQLPEGAVVDSPHHPGVVRSIVIRSGESRSGEWIRERRNVVDDFRKVFMKEPPAAVEMIAIFTDNDQTDEPVEAYYGAITALPE